MTSPVRSIEAEFSRYKSLAESAMAQLDQQQLNAAHPSGNAVSVIARHIAGNLASRFTDFLTTDGEKPWRQREAEFSSRAVTHAELTRTWERGWACLFDALRPLDDDDLQRSVRIRGQSLRVHAALHRALAHVSYHVGQIVHVARAMRGQAWCFLSIPPGGSEAYDRDPVNERPEAHAETMKRRLGQAPPDEGAP